MKRDPERLERNTRALKEADLDAVVCALPMNVLMLTGYWPVIGTALGIFTREGQSILLVPEDELDLVRADSADHVQTFSRGSLSELKSVRETVRTTLAEVAAKLKIKGIIGFEDDAASEPATYAAMNIYGASLVKLLTDAMPQNSLIPASGILTRLGSVLTADEIKRVKTACEIAGKAFMHGKERIAEGLRETEIANGFQRELNDFDHEHDEVQRSGGFFFCMSGENAYKASASYQLSRQRRVKIGDLVLVHCNSYADGYWTDITRTFCLGEPEPRIQEMYAAVFDARQAAIMQVGAGARASQVDRSARQILNERGFEREFKHGLGHGVGFHAINHNAPPRLHPASPDVLESGMVFNIEPAIYIEGFGGMRHCDMVAVTEHGAEILTGFHSGVEQMIVANEKVRGRESNAGG